jgi:YegS/Rv2252/BmrU family lipid kinase
MPSVAFVINRTLLRDPAGFARRCRAAAQERGWESWLVETSETETGGVLARRAVAAGASLVFAAGGDGTVRACAQALARTGVPLAIVPLGTANLTARALGLPSRAGQAIEAGFGGWDRRIDMAQVNGTGADGAGFGADGAGFGADGAGFAAMAGMGLDAAVVGSARSHVKRRLGWIAYAASGVTHLSRPPCDFTVRLDDGEPLRRRARCVVVGNIGLLPGGFALLPGATLDDGLLHVGILAPAGLLGWLRVAHRIVTRNPHQDRQLERFQARRVLIQASTELPRQIDGEMIAPGRTLDISVCPGVLIVRQPQRGGEYGAEGRAVREKLDLSRGRRERDSDA